MKPKFLTFDTALICMLSAALGITIGEYDKAKKKYNEVLSREKSIISNAIRMGYITNNNGKLDWRLQKECQDCGGTVSE
jgi:hypothetical protein